MARFHRFKLLTPLAWLALCALALPSVSRGQEPEEAPPGPPPPHQPGQADAPLPPESPKPPEPPKLPKPPGPSPEPPLSPRGYRRMRPPERPPGPDKNWTPEQRQKFEENLKRWKSLPPGVRQELYKSNEYYRARKQREIEAAVAKSGLKLSPERGRLFAEKFTKARRAIEEQIRKEMNDKRTAAVSQLIESLKKEFEAMPPEPEPTPTPAPVHGSNEKPKENAGKDSKAEGAKAEGAKAEEANAEGAKPTPASTPSETPAKENKGSQGET